MNNLLITQQTIRDLMKTFREIKGQDRAITILQKAYKNDAVSHAYLFVGLSGIGKSLVAKNFIKLLNCKNVSDDLNPCGICKNCTKIDTNSFIDFIYIKPETGKSVIKISQIREVEEKLAYKSYSGYKKVILIEDSHQMNISSANALLKTLEEPPDNTIFILTTSNIDKLPATILSRTQKIIFTPLDKTMVLNKLKSIFSENSKEELDIAASLSQGSITNAIDFIKNDLLTKRKEFLDSLLISQNMKFSTIINLIKNMMKKYKTKDFNMISTLLEYLKTIIRDAVILAFDLNYSFVLNKDYLEEIKKLAKISEKKLINEIDKITKLQNDIYTNVNTEVILESYFINFLRETS